LSWLKSQKLIGNYGIFSIPLDSLTENGRENCEDIENLKRGCEKEVVNFT